MTVQVLVQHVICSCKDQAWQKQTFIGLAAYNRGGGHFGQRSCRFWGANNIKNTIAIFLCFN